LGIVTTESAHVTTISDSFTTKTTFVTTMSGVFTTKTAHVTTKTAHVTTIFEHFHCRERFVTTKCGSVCACHHHMWMIFCHHHKCREKVTTKTEKKWEKYTKPGVAPKSHVFFGVTTKNA
jgi:hypothetical protein